jgi:hypothetical protein
MTEVAKKLQRGWITRGPASLDGLVSDALSEMQSLRDEMTEWKDNMEERLSNTPKYEEVSECVDSLEQFCDNEPTIPVAVPEGLTVELTWDEKKGKSRQSRNDRMSSAVMDIQRVAEHVREFVDDHGEDHACWDDEGPSYDDWDQYATELEDLISEAEGVSFPGMY